MFNSITLIGNVTRDPEIRSTPAGKEVLDLSIACTSTLGKGRKDTLFIDATCWGKQAEHCARYLSKGSRVLVEGRLECQGWIDKQTNEKKKKYKVQANRVVFLTKATEKADPQDAPHDTATPPPAADDDFDANGGAEHSPEIPF